MMATSEERLKILQMIQDEKITAEDGARLLAAVSKGDRWTRKQEGRHVRITDLPNGKGRLNVNLPPRQSGAGLNIASSFVHDIAGDNISDAIQEALARKVIDMAGSEDGECIEIEDGESREHFRVFIV